VHIELLPFEYYYYIEYRIEIRKKISMVIILTHDSTVSKLQDEKQFKKTQYTVTISHSKLSDTKFSLKTSSFSCPRYKAPLDN